MASFLKSKYALACLNTHTHKHKYTHKHIHTNTHEKAVFISSYLLVCLHPKNQNDPLASSGVTVKKRILFQTFHLNLKFLHVLL